MFVKKKRIDREASIVVAEKTKAQYRELVTIGVSKDIQKIEALVLEGKAIE